MNFESELAESVFKSKYLLEGETTPEQATERLVQSVAKVFPEIEEDARTYISKQWFIPAGGAWRAAGNPSHKVSHVNCTTLPPPSDDLESIFDSFYHWAKYAAYGQGEGVDISNLRPKGAKVHNSSRSSTGAVSFMPIYDAILQVIAQQGRRGASLISIRDSHPDVEDFIIIKDEEGKVESANLSIQVTDLFMNAAKNDSTWTLWFDNEYEHIERTIKARDLFEKICFNAWKRGDPGLQFIDVAKRYSNSDAIGVPITSTNACGEQFLDPNSCCNLGHINLAKFHEYGWEGFEKLIKFGIKFINATRINEINEGRSPSLDQLDKQKNVPRVGLGITGLADLFLDKDIAYGSDESISLVKELGKKLVNISYQMSYELGKKYGSYPLYNKDKIKNSEFIKYHLAEGNITEDMLDYQFNVTLNTIAPVGSGSIVSNGGGSGIEPIFSKYMVRRERATTGKWKDWFIYNPYVERYMKANNIPLTHENAEGLVGGKWVMSYDVDPLKKIKLVATMQKYVDSSISVTFNLPKTATVSQVKEIYMSAWEQGLKGVTVYRAGSRKGVLITEENYRKYMLASSATEEEMNDPTYRPPVLPCDIYITSHKGHKFIVLVGLKNNKPYEIFVSSYDPSFNTGDYKHGFIEKIESGHYMLKIQNGETKIAIQNIGKQFESVYASLSRAVSMALRFGAPVSKMVEQLNTESSFTDFEKVITRVLKKYVVDYTPVLGKNLCPICSQSLVFINGCITCSSCGYSRCD